MSETIKIAIDGPSGSGKSTLAKGLAKELGYVYVDTGAIYRTVGLFAKRNSIDPHDEEALSARFADIDISLKWEDGAQKIFLSDEDVSELIRTPEASMYASAVSALPKVRAFLLDMQRSFAKKSNVIMDGRDIGTVILPDAQVKIFMQAHPEERARRRFLEHKDDATYEQILEKIIERDAQDMNRETAPLKPAPDSIILDTSDITFEESVQKLLEIVEKRR